MRDSITAAIRHAEAIVSSSDSQELDYRREMDELMGIDGSIEAGEEYQWTAVRALAEKERGKAEAARDIVRSIVGIEAALLNLSEDTE